MLVSDLESNSKIEAMVTSFQLDKIQVTSLYDHHEDLPSSTRMFAQVIIIGNIFAQTLAVTSKDGDKTWELNFASKCSIPPTLSFMITVLRETEFGGKRLLIQLSKVNHDGPLLNLQASFSGSQLPCEYPIGSSTPFTSDTSGIFTNLNIEEDLKKMNKHISGNTSPASAQQVWMMHERILLCFTSSNYRAGLLSVLGDISLQTYQSTGATSDLNQAICAYHDAVRDCSRSQTYCTDFAKSLLQRFTVLGRLLDINKAVEVLRDANAFTSPEHPAKAGLLNTLAGALSMRFEHKGDINDLNEAIQSMDSAISLTPNDHEQKHFRLSNLGNLLSVRSKALQKSDDLLRSIVSLEAAVSLTLDDHPSHPEHLKELGCALLVRFEQLHDVDDLNQSVQKLETAISLTPEDEPDLPLWLNSLGDSFRVRFEQCGDFEDLTRAISSFESAVTSIPNSHPDLSLLLNNLGNSLLTRFEQHNNLEDLCQCIQQFELALTLNSPEHTDQPLCLNNLGNALLVRFEQLGDIDDLTQSILQFEAANSLTPDDDPAKFERLNNLGTLLDKRFEQLNKVDDLHRSIYLRQTAVCLTSDHHIESPELLANLGSSLFDRFKIDGNVDDLNQYVTLTETAMNLTLHDQPIRPLRLLNLGTAFLERFSQLGDLPDLHSAITRLEEAHTLLPDKHIDRPRILSTLGIALQTRFKYAGDLNDVNQAVDRTQAAVALTRDNDQDKPIWLNRAGSARLERFQQLGDLEDLDQARLNELKDLSQAILGFQSAITLLPDGHSTKPPSLNGLGISLMTCFGHSHDVDDLYQAKQTFETGVALTPDNHLNKPSLLNNLGNSLAECFKHSQHSDDLNQAILQRRAAIDITPEGHPSRPLWLNNLGNSLSIRFDQHHNPDDSEQLLQCYSAAACSSTGPAIVRFEAAKRWAEHARIYQRTFMLDAYAIAIELLPELAWLGLSITDRHHHLIEVGQIVRDAASAAITANEYHRAVEWLEQGRSIIWGQLLNLRSPVDELRESHCNLADQLVALSRSLETASARNISSTNTNQLQSLGNVANQYHSIALQRKELLYQIRKQTGYEKFLLPKTISELSLAARNGPVIMLNISVYQCDALVLISEFGNEVKHVPLRAFTFQHAQDLVRALSSAVECAGRTERIIVKREGQQNPNEIFGNVLSHLWVKIVKPVLDEIKITDALSQDSLQRVWWCPTGPLVFLPIHAAGIYTQNGLTALIESQRPQAKPQAALQLLGVTQPSAEGQRHIPGTHTEIKYIRQLAKDKISVLWLDQNAATIERVTQGMMKYNWVHFACHGIQSSSPTQSALLLAGSSRLTLEKIVGLALPDADLAFLSACQTATGSKELEDEAVHLAAGMLLAGYRSVIGTMWTIEDNYAPQVAKAVYTHLLETSPPDSTRAAEALHFAIKQLQESLVPEKSFLYWVPFVHFGI
ncbi:CHAT domain-containing protein [Favolaschia claudopus]|uniref:CHAT domain-containing protein n=1 Tax=Favolaschia claudopus TaxID=2862362 RepID=A0AAW0AGU4_9AGAR